MEGGSGKLGRRAAGRRVLLGVLGCVLSQPASAQVYSEDVVKALLLERIVNFLEWSTAHVGSTLELAVLGDAALGRQLERLFAGQPFAGRPLSVRHVALPADVTGADMVVIGRNQASDLAAVLRQCAREGVLTVGDTDGFGKAGVAINFFRDGSRVRFELRPDVLKRARIQPSYKLLSLARVLGER